MKFRIAAAISLLASSALAQTPPINLTPSSGQSIVSPVLSGTVTGTYTLGGTPTITGLVSLNGVAPAFGLDPTTNGASVAQNRGGGGTVPGEIITIAGAATLYVQSTLGGTASTTPVSGGSGGANGACTVQGTTGTAAGGRSQWSGTVSGGVLGTLTIVSQGVYTVNPINVNVEPVTPVSGCAGLTGATVQMKMSIWEVRTDSAGSIIAAPANPVAEVSSSGATTGATFNVAWKPLSTPSGQWFDTLSGANIWRLEVPDTKGLFLGAVKTGPVFFANGTTFSDNGTGRNVNYAEAIGSQLGVGVVKFGALGADANIDVWVDCVSTAGTCRHNFNSGTQGSVLQLLGTANQVNHLLITGAAASSSPILAAEGSDSNINIALVPKGTGIVTIGGAAKINGYYAPTTLFISALPGMIAPTGTMANNGAVTLGTALGATYSNLYLYLPANAIVAGSAAGWYYTTCSTTTACTVFNNTYTSGQPTIPVSPTAFVTTGPGAYTGVVTEQAYPVFVMAAGTMGPRDRIKMETLFSRNATTNTSVLKHEANGPGGSAFFANNQGGSTIKTQAVTSWVANRESQSSQVSCTGNGQPAGCAGTATTTPTTTSVNFANQNTLGPTVTNGAATDYVGVEMFTLTLEKSN